MLLSREQLTGCDDSHLSYRGAVGLLPECWSAFDALRERALVEGFDLQIASGFRSFERQLAIFNDKLSGVRAVHDEAGEPLFMEALSATDKLAAVLRYSALPGTSRHHWGTDMDVYDAAAIPTDYQLQLSPPEVADSGIFGPLHQWLDAQIKAGSAEGFYRPYGRDRGGVAPERWHLSLRPIADSCMQGLSIECLREALADVELQLADVVLAQLPELYTRYVLVDTN